VLVQGKARHDERGATANVPWKRPELILLVLPVVIKITKKEKSGFRLRVCPDNGGSGLDDDRSLHGRKVFQCIGIGALDPALVTFTEGKCPLATGHDIAGVEHNGTVYGCHD
jgi:hypothetical protein